MVSTASLKAVDDEIIGKVSSLSSYLFIAVVTILCLLASTFRLKSKHEKLHPDHSKYIQKSIEPQKHTINKMNADQYIYNYNSR